NVEFAQFEAAPKMTVPLHNEPLPFANSYEYIRYQNYLLIGGSPIVESRRETPGEGHASIPPSYPATGRRGRRAPGRNEDRKGAGLSDAARTFDGGISTWNITRHSRAPRGPNAGGAPRPIVCRREPTRRRWQSRD